MTRFARAKGSKSSNERLPEDATSWNEMRNQLLQKQNEVSESNDRNAMNAKRLESYNKFLKEHEGEASANVKWADFSHLNSIINGGNSGNMKMKVKKNNNKNSTELMPIQVVEKKTKKMNGNVEPTLIHQNGETIGKNKGKKNNGNVQSTLIHENGESIKKKKGKNNNLQSEQMKDISVDSTKKRKKRKANETDNLESINNFSDDIQEFAIKKKKKNAKSVLEITEAYLQNKTDVVSNIKNNLKQKVKKNRNNNEVKNDSDLKNSQNNIDESEPTVVENQKPSDVNAKKKKNLKGSVVMPIIKPVEQLTLEDLKKVKKQARRQRQIEKRKLLRVAKLAADNPDEVLKNDSNPKNSENNLDESDPTMMENQTPSNATAEKPKGKKKKKLKGSVVMPIKKPMEELTAEELKKVEKKQARRQRQLEKRKLLREAKLAADGEKPDFTKPKEVPKALVEKKKKTLKEPKRRKPNTQEDSMKINGKMVDVVYFDGFPIKKEDGERLKELRKVMISKGLPRNEVQAAMKLERRRAEKGLSRQKKNVCFNCRMSGHNLSECPNLNNDGVIDTAASGICFKCGSTEHTHFQCKVVRDQEFKFATCFICKEPGHIAKQCPDNARGLYPKGGACKLCGDVTHLKKDCPTHRAEQEANTIGLELIGNDIEGLDSVKKEVVVKEKPKNKVVKF